MLPHWALSFMVKRTLSFDYNAMTTLVGWCEPRKLVTEQYNKPCPLPVCIMLYRVAADNGKQIPVTATSIMSLVEAGPSTDETLKQISALQTSLDASLSGLRPLIAE